MDADGFACQTMLGRVETLVVEAALDAWSVTTQPTPSRTSRPRIAWWRRVGDGDHRGEFADKEL